MDVVTGHVYTVPALDLLLPGPLPLGIERFYTTGALDRDIGLGPGWSHSLSWEVELRRSTAVVWLPDGSAVHLPMPAPGQAVRVRAGWVLTRTEAGFEVHGAGPIHIFAEAARIGQRYLLTEIRDQRGNRVILTYDRGVLARVIDSVGRELRVRRSPHGRITAFEVLDGTRGTWVARRTYVHDDAGNLVRVDDPLGIYESYAYDDDHRLTSLRHAGGLTFYYRYSSSGLCIETWGAYPDRRDPSLARDLPVRLADNETIVKGIFHVKIDYSADDYREVIDSVRVRRISVGPHGAVEKATSGAHVYTRTFDADGRITSATDAIQATTRWTYDAADRLASMIDPLGGVTSFSYDEVRCADEVTWADGSVVRRYLDPRGLLTAIEDDLGQVVAYEHDARGLLVAALLPNGGRTRMEVDAHGNRVRIIEPDGAEKRIEYDWFGRPRRLTDVAGEVTEYTYDQRGGLASITAPGGRTTRWTYDAGGHVAQIIDDDGLPWEFAWGGLHRLCEIKRPDGAIIRYAYDLEGNLVEVRNGRGEVHRLSYDTAGRLVGEHTFDGRARRYRRDGAGRIIQIVGDQGAEIEANYDDAGQLICRTYSDDSTDHFEHDELGRVVRASTSDTSCEFVYDARGRRVREIQTMRGATHIVETRYDALGLRAARKTSLGHVERIERDVTGAPRRVELGAGEEVIIARDVTGRRTERRLPGGGTIASEYDGAGRLVRRRVSGRAELPRRLGEPAWVGPIPETTRRDRAYQYSPGGALLAEWDHARGITRYEHDRAGQLIARLPERGDMERFTYGPGANLHVAGESREYGDGGRLLRRGAWLYRYDSSGRLIEKRMPSPEGGPEIVVRYRWSAQNLLRAVEQPDGTLIEHVYDAFARRVIKRVSSAEIPGGKLVLRRETRFVWDGDELVHELCTTWHAGADPVVEERTYFFHAGTNAPWAHRASRISGETRTEGPWLYYINDSIGTPELLVSRTGDVVAEITRTAWGRATSADGGAPFTPLRFRGQYADEETGLVYNKWRYYDPDAGLYISPDPIGLEGGLDAYAYAANDPTKYVDPDGLYAETTITDDEGNTYKGYSGSSGKGSGNVHPAVKAAMPGGVYNEHGTLIYPKGSAVSPGGCSEVDGLSNYLHAYEKKNPHKAPLNPETEEGRKNIGEALSKIPNNGIKTTWQGDGPDDRYKKGEPMAPCANCGAMMANMGTMYPAPGGGPGLKQRAAAPGFPAAREGQPWPTTTMRAEPMADKYRNLGGKGAPQGWGAKPNLGY
ncbi:RHS repeat-associated core domain-containing protein [Sorangium sp. So ce291]|uniref:RHS repeat-associated core domain-containing protein n=1 Tax=Sorangium sp. So ce291 TaxID=3133294 RepID=UPI003F6451F3